MLFFKIFISTLVIFIALLFSDGIAQNNIPELITDRPDITESPNTVFPGWLQIESGFSFSETEFTNELGVNKVNVYNLAGTLFRFGLSRIVELRAGGGYQIKHTENNVESTDVSGISDILIGTKIALVHKSNNLPDIGILLHIYLPLGNRVFRSDVLEPEIILAGASDINEKFSLGYNAGGRWNFEDNQDVYTFSLAGGYNIMNNFGGFLEAVVQLSNVISPLYTIDGGIIYLLQNNLQLDLSAGTDVFSDDSPWFVNIGLSVRIPR